jgi:hypothetical protein
MRKYSVVASHVDDDFVWNVYEHATNQVIESFFFEEDAMAMAKFYENGGAFDGFTPYFLTAKPELPKEDINQSFMRAFS